MKKFSLLCLGTLLIIAQPSCKKDEVVENTYKSLQQQVVENYASIVYATYLDALNEANEFKTLVQDFVSAPSQAKFDNLKSEYSYHVRFAYEQSEAFRFYGGPIDNDTDGPEGFLNSWPMDESYVDYTYANSTSGIINDLINYPAIDKDVLTTLNGSVSETSISCGYHVIEFLLWGQDLFAGSGGQRPYTDFVSDGSGTSMNQMRRGQYLLACCELLADNLNKVVAQWKPGASNYRAEFVKDPMKSLKLLISGMGEFSKGELAGERMTVAYNSQDQEDEHSCFSDQTHNDIRLGQKSITNIYFGTYTTMSGTVIEGPGIDELIKAKNPELNQKMVEAFNATSTAVGLIPAPFDQAIINASGRPLVLDAINKLKAQADKLVEAAALIGVKLTL